MTLGGYERIRRSREDCLVCVERMAEKFCGLDGVKLVADRGTFSSGLEPDGATATATRDKAGSKKEAVRQSPLTE